ncbi:MAG: hypothetical protein M1326_05185 [Cyanobacteria bacterium]|nr:hypothetical protein [Cyanobacteriota bacterium]
MRLLTKHNLFRYWEENKKYDFLFYILLIIVYVIERIIKYYIKSGYFEWMDSYRALFILTFLPLIFLLIFNFLRPSHPIRMAFILPLIILIWVIIKIIKKWDITNLLDKYFWLHLEFIIIAIGVYTFLCIGLSYLSAWVRKKLDKNIKQES